VNSGLAVAFLIRIGVAVKRQGYERTDLRRRKLPGIAVTVLVVVAALCIGFLSGCTSDESKAREYLYAAHEKGKRVALYTQRLIDQGQQLQDFFNAIQNITPGTADAMKKLFAAVVKDVEAINTAAQATKPEYDKILDLGDVAQFKKLAHNRLDVLDLTNKRSQLIKQFAAIYNTVIDQSVNGEPINEDLVKSETTRILAERGKITDEIDKLNTQAADIAKTLDIQF